MQRARWRVMLSGVSSGPHNMAVDEALMAYASGQNECVLRVYGWSRPTLSFGRNQTVRGRYVRERIRDAGLDCVRRPTGGRSVLHCREVTYSVAAPLERLGALRESYARINRILLHGLQSLNVSAGVTAASEAMPPGPGPCFAHPSTGELVFNGRKLVGSAQWRDESALLQHGSILVRDDQRTIETLLQDADIAASPPATLFEALGREPALGEVAAALHDAVVTLEDSEASPLGMDALSSAVLARGLEKYSDESWTWRR